MFYSNHNSCSLYCVNTYHIHIMFCSNLMTLRMIQYFEGTEPIHSDTNASIKSGQMLSKFCTEFVHIRFCLFKYVCMLANRNNNHAWKMHTIARLSWHSKCIAPFLVLCHKNKLILGLQWAYKKKNTHTLKTTDQNQQQLEVKPIHHSQPFHQQ